MSHDPTGNTEPEPVGPAIRLLRQQASLSLADLARKINYSRGYISKVETGAAPANETFARQCDQFFGTGGTLAALLRSRAASATARQARAAIHPFDLPPAPSHFTGRDSELAAIEAYGDCDDVGAGIGAAPVTVVCGMPGIGKTALVVHAGHYMRSRYPDGCLYLELSTRDPTGGISTDEALDRLLRRLGVPGDSIPLHVTDRAAMYRSLLHNRRVLIILDDARRGDQVAALVPATSGCRVLATSRRRLAALDGAQVLRLGPLAPTAASTLFRDVCGGERLELEHDADDAVARIARACAGLPLAVRTVASRYRARLRLSLIDASRQLAEPTGLFTALDDGERSVQRTLASACADLAPQLRTLLALLSLHPGTSITIDAATWISGRPTEIVADDLDRLSQDSLLDARANGSYTMHDIVRAFAGLLDPPDSSIRQSSMIQLIDAYVSAAHAADEMLTPHRYRPVSPTALVSARFADRDHAFRWCESELDNIVAVARLALAIGSDQQCWHLAYAMRGYFFIAKARDQWITTHHMALEASQRSNDVWAQAVTRNNLGLALVEGGRITLAEPHYRAALEIFTALGDERGRAVTLGHQAWTHYLQGRLLTARRLAAQAQVLYERQGDSRGYAITTRTLALAEAASGQHTNAVVLLETALETFEDLDLSIDVAMTLNCLGEVFAQMDDDAAARNAFQWAVSASHDARSDYELTRAMDGLGHSSA